MSMSSPVGVSETIVVPPASSAPASSVSWGAIIAGAVAASALTLVLLGLGSALGLTAVSPWQNQGATAKTVTIAAGVWLFITQIFSAGLGGYIAGRLRTTWDIQVDESYFRDTAHGFLVWALGAVLSAALLASAASGIISGGATLAGRAASAVGGAASTAASRVDPRQVTNYFTDTLLRPQSPNANASSEEARGEISRILTESARTGQITPADKSYVAAIIAARAGISQADAEKRVADTVAKAKETAAKAETEARQAADTARKAAAGATFVTFLCMFFGALTASIAATIGGHHRDEP